jgi:hypothetical protein
MGKMHLEVLAVLLVTVISVMLMLTPTLLMLMLMLCRRTAPDAVGHSLPEGVQSLLIEPPLQPVQQQQIAPSLNLADRPRSVCDALQTRLVSVHSPPPTGDCTCLV